MKKQVLLTLIGAVFVCFISADDSDKRTPWGTPDFTGTYDVGTLTPLSRPNWAGKNQFITKEQADEIAKRHAASMAAGSGNKDPNREAPPAGGDGSPGPAGNVGGYNSFWIAQGDGYAEVDGKFRTSIIYYPENGQRPGFTPAAGARLASLYRQYRRGNDGTAYWLEDSYRDQVGPYDDPEILSLADRCLLGFSSTGGPPMLPALYNNIKRIVQGPDTVTILIEMVHDARTVRLNSEHAPEDVRNWLGDSIGWWDGDTLVVETTNFNDTPALGGASRDLKVTERFSRLSDSAILYDFTVEDPATWQDKWSGAYPWPETKDRLFEYACHEGNYAMGNILRGARRLEREFIAEGE